MISNFCRVIETNGISLVVTLALIAKLSRRFDFPMCLLLLLVVVVVCAFTQGSQMWDRGYLCICFCFSKTEQGICFEELAPCDSRVWLLWNKCCLLQGQWGPSPRLAAGQREWVFCFILSSRGLSAETWTVFALRGAHEPVHQGVCISGYKARCLVA